MRALRRSVCGLLGLALICGACSSRPAAPLHVRLDAGPVTAPFDTPVHLTAQFFMNDTGFSLTMRVLAEGHVQTAVTLRREGTPPSSVQTVRQDGFASTLFVPRRSGLALRPLSSSAARKAARTPSPPTRSR